MRSTKALKKWASGSATSIGEPFVERGKADAADAGAISVAAPRKPARYSHLSELDMVAGFGIGKVAALIEIMPDEAAAGCRGRRASH